MKINTYKAVAYNLYSYKQFCVCQRFVEWHDFISKFENYSINENLIKHYEYNFKTYFDFDSSAYSLNDKLIAYDTISTEFLDYVKYNNIRLYDVFIKYFVSMKMRSVRTRTTIKFMLDYINDYTEFYGSNNLKLIFLTFTFNDKYLVKLDNITKRRYVTMFLNSPNIIDYIGNIDYGTLNGRIHFHVLALVDGSVNYTSWRYGTLNGVKAVIHNGAMGGYIDKLSNHELKVKILDNATIKNGKQYNVYKLRCRNKRYNKQLLDLVGKDLNEILTPVKVDSLPFDTMDELPY